MSARTIEIAGVRLTVLGMSGPWPLPTFPFFETHCPPTVRNHWTLEYSHSELPQYGSEPLFDSGESWACFRGSEDSLDFVQYTRDVDSKRVPQGLMRIYRKERHAELFDTQGIGLSYPFDELFFLNAFAPIGRVLVHSCAVERHGRGTLFCGESGAGKSTLGEILQKEGWNVLCDERNAIAANETGFTLFTTPWYGTGEICRRAALPLEKIVILDPSHEGFSLNQLPIHEAIGEFMRVVFLPQFSPSGVAQTMDTIQKILLGVPVYRLNYAKDMVDIAARLGEFSQGYADTSLSRIHSLQFASLP